MACHLGILTLVSRARQPWMLVSGSSPGPEDWDIHPELQMLFKTSPAKNSASEAIKK